MAPSPAAIARRELPTGTQTNQMMGPVIRAGGYIDDVIELAGPAARRDMRRAAPPMAVIGRVASLLKSVPRARRGLVAATAMLAAMLAAMVLSLAAVLVLL